MNLEECYIKRLQTILNVQTSMVANDKDLTDEEKHRQLLLINVLLSNIDMFINEVYVNKGVAR